MTRRVRTPEGSRRYRLPIGAPIVAKPETVEDVVAHLRRLGMGGAVDIVAREAQGVNGVAILSDPAVYRSVVTLVHDVGLRPPEERFLPKTSARDGPPSMLARNLVLTLKVVSDPEVARAVTDHFRHKLLEDPDEKVTPRLLTRSWVDLRDLATVGPVAEVRRALEIHDVAVRADWGLNGYRTGMWRGLAAHADTDVLRAMADESSPWRGKQWALAYVLAISMLPAEHRKRTFDLAPDVVALLDEFPRSSNDPPERVAARAVEKVWTLDIVPPDTRLFVLRALVATDDDWSDDDVRAFAEAVSGTEILDDRWSRLAEDAANLWRRDRSALADAVDPALRIPTSEGRREFALTKRMAWAAIVHDPEMRRRVVTEPDPGVRAGLLLLGRGATEDRRAVVADLVGKGWSPVAAAWAARHADRLRRVPDGANRDEALAVLSMSDDEWERYRSERDSGADHLAAWRRVLGVRAVTEPVTAERPEGRRPLEVEWAEDDSREVLKGETAERLAGVLDPFDGPIPLEEGMGEDWLLSHALWRDAPHQWLVQPPYDWEDSELFRSVIVALPRGQKLFRVDSDADYAAPDPSRWSRRVAAHVIHTWAQTANDENPLALAIQERARVLFGLEGTMDWRMTDQFREEVDRLVAEAGPWIDRILAAMWRETQRRYPADGVFDLNRGWRHVELGPPPPEGRDVEFALRPLSSWSTSWETARGFAAGPQGRLASAWVPVERVLCNADGIGFGCLTEREFVVLGGPTRARVARTSS